MTLPMGDISVGMVATEIGASLPLNLGDSRVRALAGVASGPISLGQLRGKTYFQASLSAERTSVLAGPAINRYMLYTDTITCAAAGATGWAWSLNQAGVSGGAVTGTDQGGGVYRVQWSIPIEEGEPMYGSFVVTCTATRPGLSSTASRTRYI